MNEQISKKDLLNQLLLAFNIAYYNLQEIKGVNVTLFKFRPKIGVRIAKIRNLKDELASALGVPFVRIIAPMEDGSIGIEVPNSKRKVLPASIIFNSRSFQNTAIQLPCALGKTASNEIFIADLTEMPHLLVAGATGQGKSVGLNLIIMSLLQKKKPDELNLVLIDPKKVEFSVYSSLENSYLACPVITDAEEAQRKLESICSLMNERYDLLTKACVRNIQEYNAHSKVEKMPYIVTVIDEYGDLIMTADKKMEQTICRIAQKARAVGIHLIIATQRPNTKIVTGNIKANFPARIAFRTSSGNDSRIILDQMGAENLTGKGDMFFLDGNGAIRMQCAYASIEDIRATCDEINKKYDGCYSPFSLPECPIEKAQQTLSDIQSQIREEMEARERAFWEEQQKKYEEEKEHKRYMEEHKEEIKARRERLYRHFYGSNTSYMTLYIPHESKIRKKK